MFENLNLRYLALNALIFAGSVAIPAYLIAYSNKHVFPTTLTMANGFLVMSILAAIASMIVAAHKGADNRTVAGALLFEILLGFVLWWNIGGHWQLSREYDAAQSTVQENREEDTIARDREKERVENEKVLSDLRQKEMKEAAGLERQQAINRDAAVRLARASGLAPMVRPRPAVTPLPVSTPTPVSQARTARPAGTPRPIPPTPSEVRESWMGTLTTRAYVEAGVAILTLIGLGILWHIDFDGDGVRDRIQRLPRQIVQDLYPEDYEKLYGANAGAEALPPADLGDMEVKASLPSRAARANFTPTPSPPPTQEPTAPEIAPKTAPEGTAPRYPHAGTSRGGQKGGVQKAAKKPPSELGAGVREGKHWRVLGRLLPDIEDARYKGRKKKCTIEVRTEAGQWLCQFGKQEIERLDQLSEADRFQKIQDKIAIAKVRKSEKEFSNNEENGIGVTGVD